MTNLGLLQLALIMTKSLDLIDISWVLVFVPLYVYIILVLLTIIIILWAKL